MEAKELRIGNKIFFIICDKENSNLDEKKEITVDISDFEFIRDNNSLFEGIPLTEEWLLKFGFLIDGEEYRLEGISIEDIHNGVKWVVYMFDEYHAVECSLAIVQHVHTLQNLYFALTNEELTIIS